MPADGPDAVRPTPEGGLDDHSTIIPYFTVSDADRLIAFVTDTFEGTVFKEVRNNQGRVQHARIRIGGSVMMLDEANDSYPANESQVHIYVDDVDATFGRALSNGAAAIMDPNERPHGDRMAGVRGPCANTWWIAAPGQEEPIFRL